MILTMIALEYSWTGSSSPHAVLAGVTRTLSSHDETQPASHKLQVPS